MLWYLRCFRSIFKALEAHYGCFWGMWSLSHNPPLWPFSPDSPSVVWCDFKVLGLRQESVTFDTTLDCAAHNTRGDLSHRRRLRHMFSVSGATTSSLTVLGRMKASWLGTCRVWTCHRIRSRVSIRGLIQAENEALHQTSQHSPHIKRLLFITAMLPSPYSQNRLPYTLNLQHLWVCKLLISSNIN